MRLTGILALTLIPLAAGAMPCDLTAYKAAPGLTAAFASDVLTVSWEGDHGQEARLRFVIDEGKPVIRELSLRPKSGQWTTLIRDASPVYTIATGKRRMSNQQMEPLVGLGVKITDEIKNKFKWDAFWDAPLDVPGNRADGASMGSNPPPDLPRLASEVYRGSAAFHASACAVKTNGARLEISFPGVELGSFSGRLQFTVYRGTNLIRQEIIASTQADSVAYKYDTGWESLAIAPDSKLAWRDLSGTWQNYEFGGARNDQDVALKTSNRLLVLQQGARGSIATFPPPHTFFWAREEETNLGYNFYRKQNDKIFSFGIRQAEKEEDPRYKPNFALYSAPAGSEQHMAGYFYPSLSPAAQTADRVLAFTHGDRFKAIPGYQVMAHHYHMDLAERLREAGSMDAHIPDLDVIKSLGVTIASEISSVFIGRNNRQAPDFPKLVADSVEGARRHSDRNFLVMPDLEVYGSPLGGHTDLLFSHPVYWTEKKNEQPFVEQNSTYGKVYHIGTAEEFIEMARREDVLISMPHPRTKGSTGFPDAIKDQAFFSDPHYHGVGFRWGMGLDLSEQRLCGRRCLDLLDDMSNWMADKQVAGKAVPLKRLIAITETRLKAPGDDVYAASPVNYIKLDRIPTSDDVSPVVKSLMNGDSFVSSGEVLMPEFSVQGVGDTRTVNVQLDWTFPLEFYEIVWGDGTTTSRKLIPATDLPPFGTRRFQIPLAAAGQKWVRFAAWDSAGNGVISQPVRLTATK